MKRWFDVWVCAGPAERRLSVFGSLGFALRVAQSVACHEQADTELSCRGEDPFLRFDDRGRPVTLSSSPLVLSLPVDPRRLGEVRM